MDSKDNGYVEQFYKALEGWTDERFASRQDLRELAMFNLYLVNLSEEDGWQYDGHSLNRASPMWRLVVRGTVEEVPCVVFTSGRTTMACVHIFLRKLEEGLLEWTKDRFRT